MNLIKKYLLKIPLKIPFKINDYIYFGIFNKEPILWKVINIDDTGAPLLFSEKVLEKKAFDVGNSNVWVTSSIRNWINDIFLQNSFTTNEQAMIKETYLPDVNSRDKIFLLSESEITSYISETAEKIRTIKISPSWYWLRSPSNLNFNGIRFVYCDGFIDNYYACANYMSGGFAPALVLNLIFPIQKIGVGTKENPYILEKR